MQMFEWIAYYLTYIKRIGIMSAPPGVRKIFRFSRREYKVRLFQKAKIRFDNEFESDIMKTEMKRDRDIGEFIKEQKPK